MNLIFTCICVLSVAFADDGLEEFTKGSLAFSGDVYNQLLVDNKDNILVSPFSAEVILALAQSGAVGATGEEIRTSLHLSQEEKTFQDVLSSLDTKWISLHTANKIFVENGLNIKENFQNVARDVYQAQFENIDFSESQQAAEEINQWVEEETNNKIKNLVTPDDLDASTKLVLANALYFHGNWSIPFIPQDSQEAKFYTSEDTTVDITLMYQQPDYYNYAESEELDAQFVELPFEGKEASMVVVLPNKKDGIAILDNKISDVLNVLKFTEELVLVQLPKFKIESTIDFKDVLQKMGVQKAFDPAEADFSGIAGKKGDLLISAFKQKTYIDVSEIGVEAAAASEIPIYQAGSKPPDKTLIADHPFIFYIKRQNLVLFEGRVMVPEYE